MMRNPSSLERLAELIDDRWSATGCRIDSFSTAACSALEELGLHETLGMRGILDHIAKNEARFIGTGRHFSADSINLLTTSRFTIGANFWYGKVVELHSHSWHGAFQVIQGANFHARYDWSLEERLAATVWRGRLAFREVETLERGDVVAVSAGDGLIHGITHLELPAVNLVVRMADPREKTVTYWRPSIAIDTDVVSHDGEKELHKLFALMPTIAPDAYIELARDAIGHWDFETVTRLLRNALGHHPGRGALDPLYEAARERFGSIADVLRESFADEARVNAAAAFRGRTRDPDALGLVGLLFLTDSADELRDAACRRWPDFDSEAGVERLLGRVFREGSPLSLSAEATKIVARMFSGRSDEEITRELGTACSPLVKTLRAMPLLTPMVRRR